MTRKDNENRQVALVGSRVGSHIPTDLNAAATRYVARIALDEQDRDMLIDMLGLNGRPIRLTNKAKAESAAIEAL